MCWVEPHEYGNPVTAVPSGGDHGFWLAVEVQGSFVGSRSRASSGKQLSGEIVIPCGACVSFYVYPRAYALGCFMLPLRGWVVVMLSAFATRSVLGLGGFG